MIAEIDVSHEQKIIIRTLTGEIDPNQATRLIREIAFSVCQHEGYHILVDIRDTTFEPATGDLLEIATECSRQLGCHNRKIAFIIPDTPQRREVAKLFKTCMETQGFRFRQFFDFEAAIGWLSD